MPFVRLVAPLPARNDIFTHVLAMLAIIGASLGGGAAVAPIAALAQGDWQNDLAAEILILEDCEVSFLTQVIEREIEGRAVVMAKVHCADGRTFDALREDAFAAFDFAICEPEDEPAAC